MLRDNHLRNDKLENKKTTVPLINKQYILMQEVKLHTSTFANNCIHIFTISHKNISRVYSTYYPTTLLLYPHPVFGLHLYQKPISYSMLSHRYVHVPMSSIKQDDIRCRHLTLL